MATSGPSESRSLLRDSIKVSHPVSAAMEDGSGVYVLGDLARSDGIDVSLCRPRPERIRSLTSESLTQPPNQKSPTRQATTSGTGCPSSRSSREKVGFDRSRLLSNNLIAFFPPLLPAAIHDPSAKLSKKELEKLGYPMPIVDHAKARLRAIARYKKYDHILTVRYVVTHSSLVQPWGRNRRVMRLERAGEGEPVRVVMSVE